MYLEKLEIQGFKSFANPVTLIFNKELTAIVGPNGSGKSNVGDSIRWVLGEQSLKLLRGKKSDDVIFAGSDKKGRLGFAKVKITMNNESHSAGIDYDEIIIERTINRTGESDYFLNNNRARLSDILLLLAKAQVGQKSYSVIGQGTIDHFLTLSAQERKDYFDEATGVKQYQLKKHQAINKLERTEENLQQAGIVLQEITPRLHTLTRQVRRLERKEEIEKNLLETQNDYYSHLMHELMEQLGGVTMRKDKEEKLLAAVTAEQKTIQHELDVQEHEQGRDDAFNLLQKKLFNLQQEYNATTKKKIVLEGEKDLDLIKKGGRDQVLTSQRREEIESKLRTLAVSLQEHEAHEKKLKAVIDSLSQRIRSSEHKLKTLERELSQNTAVDWQTLQKQADTLHAEHGAIEAALTSLDAPHALENFKRLFVEYAQRLKTFLSQIKERHVNQGEAVQEFAAFSKEHAVVVAELHSQETALQVSERERALLSAQLHELEKERENLAASQDTIKDARTVSQELSALDQELKTKEKEIVAIRSEIDNFNQAQEGKKKDLVNLQKKMRNLQYDYTIKNNELTTLKVEHGKLETKKEDLDAEIAHEAPKFTLQPPKQINVAQVQEQITTLKRQLGIIGGIDTETVKEYEEVKEKHTYLTQQSADLHKAMESLTKLIKDLDEQINKQFEANFKNINALFTKYFKRLFSGGSAKLTIEFQRGEAAPEDIQESDTGEMAADATEDKEKKAFVPLSKKFRDLDYTVEIQATPPGKKLSSINVLSGGEKAMTAIALICSIIANNPPPFVVLDEVDAALDEANSIRFAEIITELKDRTQFITITHNRATMHQAQILYGVTMGGDSISRLLSVNFEQADQISA